MRDCRGVLQSRVKMCEDEFIDIERQLEETLRELRDTHAQPLRRNLLAHMRLLLAEADRLLLETETDQNHKEDWN
jgi:hypothetical protein